MGDADLGTSRPGPGATPRTSGGEAHPIDPDGRPYAPRAWGKPGVGPEGFFRRRHASRAGDRRRALPRGPQARLEADGRLRSVVGTLRTSAQVTNYTADELEGGMVVGALNLGRKRIAGFTSEFLVLGALDPDGTVRLLELPDDVAPGAPIA